MAAAMIRALLAMFLVSAAWLVLALMGHGVSFRAFGTRVSAESAGRLVVITALTGLCWLLLHTRHHARRDAARDAGEAPSLDAAARVWLCLSIAIALSVAIGLAVSLRTVPPAHPTGDAAL